MSETLVVTGAGARAYYFTLTPDGLAHPERDPDILCHFCKVTFKGPRAFDWHGCEEHYGAA